MIFQGIHHVQLCIPYQKEQEARDFYSGILGLYEIKKPPALQKNGGVWFQAGLHELHIGVEDAETHKGKQHPAFLISGLDELQEKLLLHGFKINKELPIPGYKRFSIRDPFNNRIEFIEQL